MTKFKPKLTRKSAVFIIIAAAALLAVIVLICSGGGLDTPEERAEYLASLGWEVDLSTEEERAVTLPSSLDGVLLTYNELQKQQGFDLTPYAGEDCRSYSYAVTNYPSGESGVIAQLIIHDGEVIGGDIHSSALGGFMHGLQ